MPFLLVTMDEQKLEPTRRHPLSAKHSIKCSQKKENLGKKTVKSYEDELHQQPKI